MRRMALLVAALAVLATMPAGAANRQTVVAADIEQPITPLTATYIKRILEIAKEKDARAVIFRLDTPGGLMTSTREIVSDFLNSDIPIVVWVGPRGSRAGSAGLFITYAAHIAAMSPGTHIGGATPVNLTGEQMGEDMRKKVVNDASAWVRSIAQTRDRNTPFSQDAVAEAVELTGQEALDTGVIEYIVEDMDELLNKISGETTVLTGRVRTIAMDAGKVEIVRVESTLKETVLKFLADPNLIYVLILLTVAGVYFEFSTPGIGVAGVVAVISACLVAYGLSILPAQPAGLLLIVIGVSMMMLDLKLATGGLLTAGGAVAMGLGGFLLFEDEVFKVAWEVLVGFTILTALVMSVVVGAAARAIWKPSEFRPESVEGRTGEVRRALAPEGQIMLDGELWTAVSRDGTTIQPPARVKVMKKDGPRLIVSPEEISGSRQ